jgi:4-amino-4-deoxy-L-arabinose transferase-like glycosyltransferase
VIPVRLWRLGLIVVLLLAAALRFVWLDRLPPGLHYDEAAYGLQALELRASPRIELFFPAFTGHEPLFIYILALSTGLLGESVYALRATAAAIGVGAVLATALAGRALFGPGVGLLGAALLATSFWHVMFSRQTHRLGLLVALAPVAVWLLWRAWRRPTLPGAVLAGAAVGLLAYTYVTARLLLLGLGLFLLLELALGGGERRRAALAALAVAAAVAAPLGLYFLGHPEQFAVRFDQTVALTGPGDLLRGVVDTLGMYGFRGDPQQKFNLPGRPALDLTLSGLLAIGAASLIARPGDARARLMLLWWLGTLAAGFLTSDSPNFGRLNPAGPPSYLIAAYGAERLWRLARPRLRLAAVGAPAVLAIALVGSEAALTADAYFVRWAPSPETYYALHGDMADLGRLARAQPEDAALYAASEHYRHPTVAFLAGHAFERLRWFDGRLALVLPPPGGSERYLVPASARPPEVELIGPVLASRADPGGATALELRARGEAAASFQQPVGLRFAPAGEPSRPWAELVGADPPTPARVGDRFRVRTVWRLLVDRPPSTPDFFAHALDASGRRWGQRDASPYLASEWRAGETLVAWLDVPIDPLAPAGVYRFRIGLNDPGAGRALEARRSDGAVVPDAAPLFAVPVEHRSGPPEGEPLAGFQRGVPAGSARADGLPADLGAMRLLAAAFPASLSVGQQGWVDLLWQARDPPRGETAVLLLRGEGGERVLTERRAADLDPNADWREGELQRDVRRLAPSRADAGRWQIVVRVGASERILGAIEIAAPAARFEAPTPQRPLDAEFLGTARLLGLDVAGDRITLYWRPLGPAEANLAVFVHVLGPYGAILTQHDGQPAGGARPTRGWIADEIVADEHPLRPPPAWSALAIGLYDPATGQRVPLTTGADHVLVPRS